MMFLCGMELIQDATSTNIKSTDGGQSVLIRREENYESSEKEHLGGKNGILKAVHYSTTIPASLCTN
uniref:Uncharacterized protein n=1 Tax=Acrobeloides nanus TaxID=290746 RepID=A0A914DYM7_9BILA